MGQAQTRLETLTIACIRPRRRGRMQAMRFALVGWRASAHSRTWTPARRAAPTGRGPAAGENGRRDRSSMESAASTGWSFGPASSRGDAVGLAQPPPRARSYQAASNARRAASDVPTGGAAQCGGDSEPGQSSLGASQCAVVRAMQSPWSLLNRHPPLTYEPCRVKGASLHLHDWCGSVVGVTVLWWP